MTAPEPIKVIALTTLLIGVAEDRRRDGTGGRRRDRPLGSGLRATGAVVLGDGSAEAQGAGERLRLPH